MRKIVVAVALLFAVSSQSQTKNVAHPDPVAAPAPLVEKIDVSVVNVDGARDGVEALHQIATNHYAVMILDVMMPKMSGVDVLDSLEALTTDPSVKALDDPPAVLVITSAETGALPDAAITQRFPGRVQRVFRKPFDIEELTSSVEKYLRRSDSQSDRLTRV